MSSLPWRRRGSIRTGLLWPGTSWTPRDLISTLAEVSGHFRALVCRRWWEVFSWLTHRQEMRYTTPSERGLEAEWRKMRGNKMSHLFWAISDTFPHVRIRWQQKGRKGLSQGFDRPQANAQKWWGNWGKSLLQIWLISMALACCIRKKHKAEQV